MTLQLSPLPYKAEALEPYISAHALTVHHDKHHATYVKTYNELTANSPLASKPLETVIQETADDEGKTAIFNNGAQSWNHAFLWNSFKPKGGGKPSGDLAHRIDEDLGGYDKFRENFTKSATSQFGSGWTWLMLDNGKLAIAHTPDADTPLAHGQKPLLTLDVWEHAYYLDYENRRPDFVKAFLDHLVNWDFAGENLAKH